VAEPQISAESAAATGFKTLPRNFKLRDDVYDEDVHRI